MLKAISSLSFFVEKIVKKNTLNIFDKEGHTMAIQKLIRLPKYVNLECSYTTSKGQCSRKATFRVTDKNGIEYILCTQHSKKYVKPF